MSQNELTCSSRYEEKDVRVSWIRNFSDYARRMNIEGSVAEAGVYRGDLSAYINRYFPERKLHLFDTFDGFDDRDKKLEFDRNKLFFSDTMRQNFFKNASVEYVKSLMPHLDQVLIHQGYFPETAYTVDGPFCFVSLDMDLYKPQLEGLRFFYDKISPGGGIVMHDYFSSFWTGTEQAVADFERERGISLIKMPLGDERSIIIIKI